jgi:hypothetical protein
MLPNAQGSGQLIRQIKSTEIDALSITGDIILEVTYFEFGTLCVQAVLQKKPENGILYVDRA